MTGNNRQQHDSNWLLKLMVEHLGRMSGNRILKLLYQHKQKDRKCQGHQIKRWGTVETCNWIRLRT